MRTFLNFPVVLSFLLLFFSGCSDDDTERPIADPPQSTAVDTIRMGETAPGSISYQLDRGELFKIFSGDTDPVMHFIGIELTSQNYSYEDYAGDIMYFNFAPSTTSDLKPGNYKFSSSTEFGLNEGYLITNGRKYILDDGNLLIEQVETGYVLTWEIKGYRETSFATNVQRVFIIGRYEGALPDTEG